jgi:hypothetical protein
MRTIMAIGELGAKITGYPVISVYNEFTTDKSNPRRGVFVDWAYDNFGAMAFTTEIWKAPGEMGKSVFEGQDENIAMEWNDRELAGKGFVNWKKYDHPQYGEVEIGGWNSNFFNQNPPPKFAEAEWKKNCLFELKHAEMLPLLKIANLEVESLGDRLFRIKAAIENDGYLPTNVTQKAIQHRIAKTVKVTIELENAELLCGSATEDLGHIAGNGPEGASRRRGSPSGQRNLKHAQWLVRTHGPSPSAMITAVSEKAGTKRKSVAIQ